MLIEILTALIVGFGVKFLVYEHLMMHLIDPRNCQSLYLKECTRKRNLEFARIEGVGSQEDLVGPRTKQEFTF